MIECRLKGGPLNGHVIKVDDAIVQSGIVQFDQPVSGWFTDKNYPISGSASRKVVRLTYRVKSANSQTAVLEFAE